MTRTQDKTSEQAPPASETAATGLIDPKLWQKILIGMILGFLCGLALSPEGLGLLSSEHMSVLSEWLSLPAALFMGLIRMVIVPLIICSIILGITHNNDALFLKNIGMRLVPYFLVTTAIAITIGLSLVNLIQPGRYIDPELLSSLTQKSGAADALPAMRFDDLTLPQRVKNMIPANPFQSILTYDMLQIVIASILIGIAALNVPQDISTPLKTFCRTGQSLTLKIIGWAMVFAPYAVFGILADITSRTGLDVLTSVAVYSATVLLGLACMFGVYLIFIGALAKSSPLAFVRNIKEVMLLAFSTSSSAATMPFSMEAAEKKLKLRPDVSRVIIPLGATINMDGTAMYQAIAAIFLCQVFGIDISIQASIL
jgi:Na+/H+-dicarboxylate symporter